MYSPQSGQLAVSQTAQPWVGTGSQKVSRLHARLE
jgi:hypothetical protein